MCVKDARELELHSREMSLIHIPSVLWLLRLCSFFLSDGVALISSVCPRPLLFSFSVLPFLLYPRSRSFRTTLVFALNAIR